MEDGAVRRGKKGSPEKDKYDMISLHVQSKKALPMNIFTKQE